jgi:excisionase family DNA binding protein
VTPGEQVDADPILRAGLRALVEREIRLARRDGARVHPRYETFADACRRDQTPAAAPVHPSEPPEAPLPRSTWLSADEVAQALGCSRSYVYRLLREGPERGGLEAAKVGSGIAVARGELERWQRRRRDHHGQDVHRRAGRVAPRLHHKADTVTAPAEVVAEVEPVVDLSVSRFTPAGYATAIGTVYTQPAGCGAPHTLGRGGTIDCLPCKLAYWQAKGDPMDTAPTWLGVRLPAWLAEQLRGEFSRSGRGAGSFGEYVGVRIHAGHLTAECPEPPAEESFGVTIPAGLLAALELEARDRGVTVQAVAAARLASNYAPAEVA